MSASPLGILSSGSFSRSGQRSHSLITGILLPSEPDRKVGQLNPGSIERGLEMKVFHYHLQIGRKELLQMIPISYLLHLAGLSIEQAGCAIS